MMGLNDGSFPDSAPKDEMIFNPFHFRQDDLSYYPFMAVSSGKRRLLHIVFWAISGLIITLFISFVKPAGEAIARGLIIIFCLMLLLYGTRVLVNRFYEEKRYGRWVTFSCIFIILAAALRVWFDLGVLHSIMFRPEELNDFNSGRIIKLYIFFLLISLIFITLATLYYISKKRLTLEHHYYKLKLQHVETQLSFLKAQVNPHFLFNTLNNIYAATELKNSNAPAMILQLSQLLRYITYTVQQKKTDLAEEWGQIENCVKLFCSKDPEGRYPIILKKTGDLDNVKISPMLLLPMVENAFKYSDMHEQVSDSYLRICLHYNAGKLQFLVVNTYSAGVPRQEINSGIGNQNIRQRLQLEYPGQHTLRTEKEKRIFTADLTLNLYD